MNDFMGQMIRTGSETLAVDYCIGAIAYGAAICWIWSGVTGKPTEGRAFWVTFILAATMVFYVTADAPFIAGRGLRAFFFNVLLPAGGWASFLILVVFAGAVLGYLFHKNGGTVSWGNARQFRQDGEEALSAPRSAARLSDECVSTPLLPAVSESEPVRLTRLSTAPVVSNRRDGVRR